MKVYCLLMILLLVPIVYASQLSYDLPFSYFHSENWTTAVPYSFTYEDTCLAQNVTITGSIQYNYTNNWTHTGEINSSQNVSCASNEDCVLGWMNLTYSNVNKTQNLTMRVENNFIILNFASNYDRLDNLLITFMNVSRSYQVFRANEIYVPIDPNYPSFNFSRAVDFKIPETLTYNITDANFSGIMDVPVQITSKPKMIPLYQNRDFKFNEIIIDRVFYQSLIPVDNFSVISDREVRYTYNMVNNIISVYLYPSTTGDYYLNYTLKDKFGNFESVNSKITVYPSMTYLFDDVIVPSVKQNEELRLVLFLANRTVNLNFTPSDISFTPDNFNGNVTDTLSFVDYSLSDFSEQNYFLFNGTTVSLNKDRVYFRFRSMEKGIFQLKMTVGSQEDVVTNKEFMIKIRVGNESILDTQEFNVMGRITKCKLTDVTDISTATRVCTTEFPLDVNLDNSLIIMSSNDYQQYELNHKNEMENLDTTWNNKYKDLTTWVVIGWFLFFIFMCSFLWVIIPKYWIVLPGGKK